MNPSPRSRPEWRQQHDSSPTVRALIRDAPTDGCPTLALFWQGWENANVVRPRPRNTHGTVTLSGAAACAAESKGNAFAFELGRGASATPFLFSAVIPNVRHFFRVLFSEKMGRRDMLFLFAKFPAHVFITHLTTNYEQLTTAHARHHPIAPLQPRPRAH